MENEFRVEPFTNEFGQVIHPGEEVVYAGLSYKTTSFKKGKFAGVYYGTVTKSVRRLDENGNAIKNERGYALWDTVRSVEPVGTKIVDVIDSVYDRETKSYVKKVRARPAILQQNRVFKLETDMTQLAGTSF